MKKRVRIVSAIISTLCLACSMLLVGVLSARTADLSVSSTLSFKSNSLYIKAKGEIRQGAKGSDAETATLQSNAPESYSYTGYTYNRVANSDRPDGTPSLDYFVDENGTEKSSWDIGTIEFSNDLPVVVFYFTFTNYTPNMAQATINIKNVGGLEGKATVDAGDELVVLQGYDGSKADVATCAIVIELSDYAPDFDVKFDVEVDFVTLSVNPEYFTYNEDYTEIRGLSSAYRNLETEPEILVFPSKAPNGTSVIGIGDFDNQYHNNFGELVPEIIFQNGIQRIGEYAFANCDNLRKVVLADSIVELGVGTFKDSGLTNVVFGKKSQLTIIGDTGFSSTDLIKLTIPQGVVTIGQSAFYGCSSLKTVILSEGLTDIGKQAFSNCSHLEEINLPDGLLNLGQDAFHNSNLLKSLIIPEGITVLNDLVFDPDSLTSMTLPSTIATIKEYALNFRSLRTLVINAETPPVVEGEGDIFSIDSNLYGLKIYVPDSSVDAYKTAEKWSTYASRIYPLSTLTA